MARKTSDVVDYLGNIGLLQSWRTVREFCIARLDKFRAILINVCACVVYILYILLLSVRMRRLICKISNFTLTLSHN